MVKLLLQIHFIGKKKVTFFKKILLCLFLFLFTLNTFPLFYFILSLAIITFTTLASIALSLQVTSFDLKEPRTEKVTKLTRTKYPHVVVLMADDVGWDDVGYHGSNSILTPNIDVLAADGVIINDFYTSPLCTPSRSAFLSGVHPTTSGDQHYVLSTGEPRGFSLKYPLIPQVLKRIANYSTHLIGKWGLGFYQQIYTPQYRGFDSFYGYYGNQIDYFTHECESEGRIGLDWRYNLIPAPQDTGKFATELITNHTIKLIQRYNKESSQPLYLQVSYPNTHIANSNDPYQAAQVHIDKLKPMIRDRNQLLYAANLFSMDESIGLILKQLQDSNLLNDTIVIFMSDNGAGGNGKGVHANYGSNFPLRGVKATLWEGAVRVPSFIWSPLLKQKSTIFNGLFHVTDWLPTIISAVQKTDPSNTRDTNEDVEVLTPEEKKSIYGISQWERIEAGTPSARKIVLHNIDPIDEVMAFRVGNFKFLRGNFNRNLDGWFGVRESIDVENYINNVPSPLSKQQVFIQALREVSITRNVLNGMSRRPNYDIFINNVLSCSFDTNLTRCNPIIEDCLFDIKNDPCETKNLAREETYQTLLKQMKILLKDYNRESSEPKTLPFDPLSDPILHGNSWIPWKDSIYSYSSVKFTNEQSTQHLQLNSLAMKILIPHFTLQLLQLLMTSMMSLHFILFYS